MPRHDLAEQRRDTLAEEPDNAREALIAELRTYLAAANLTQPQFAGMISYGTSTLKMFLAGRYHEVSGREYLIRNAIRAFLDTNRIVPEIAVDGRFYETENVGVLRVWFNHCLLPGHQQGRIASVYAGPGSQKTCAIKHLIAEHTRQHLHTSPRPRALYVYCSEGERPASLVRKVLRAAALPGTSQLQRNLETLRFHLRGVTSLVVLDEAQHLSAECLEIARELCDLPPYFGLLVLGSHRLRTFVDRNAAQMEQWHSRNIDAVELPGLKPETIASILRQELAGITDFDSPRGAKALTALVEGCLVEDIYSQERTRYYSIRKAFNTVEQVRAKAVQKGVTQ